MHRKYTKKRKKKKSEFLQAMAICPHCGSPMQSNYGVNGEFLSCIKQACGYIPNHKEIRRKMAIKRKVAQIQQEKRKQGVIG